MNFKKVQLDRTFLLKLDVTEWARELRFNTTFFGFVLFPVSFALVSALALATLIRAFCKIQIEFKRNRFHDFKNSKSPLLYRFLQMGEWFSFWAGKVLQS